MSRTKNIIILLAGLISIACGTGIVLGTTPSNPNARLTPSQAGRIALDSAYAELKGQVHQLQGLQMKYSGLMMALEPTDENDYYIYQFRFDLCEDSTAYGIVFVNCKSGSTLRVNRPTKHVQLGFAHSFQAHAEDSWINEMLNQKRDGAMLAFWGLVMVTSKTIGVCITDVLVPDQNRIQLNDQMVWIPPTLMVRDTHGEYYILNRHGQICDLSGLDTRVIHRFDIIHEHKREK